MGTTQYEPLLAPRRNVVVRRGDDDPPVEWEFGTEATPDILDGSAFILTVWMPGQPERTITSEGAGAGLTVDGANRIVRWTYTAAETRSLPAGRGTYELRRLIEGRRRTWVRGALIVLSEDPNA